MSSNNIEAAYPLSPMQQGMLFHSLAAPESGFYVTQLVYTLDHLNVAAFARAWQRVVDRHAVLRTAFAWERIEKPLQVVGRRVKLSPGQHDLRGLTPAEQEQQIAAYLEAEQRRGFKLSQAPLMRLALFQLAEETYRFVWVYHHILLDGWSLPLVLQEVLALYTAFCRGQDLDLEPPRPFREYIAWLQRQDLSAAEAFWRQQLAGFPAPTALVVDTPADDAAGEERYAEQEARVAPALTGALQALARRQHLTLSTIMQGAWALLLSRYSGEPDVLFGTPMSGRPADLPGVETMIGLFINTLPVRTAAAPEAMLLPWLKAIQDQHVRLRQYEYSPLLEIQRWSEVPRDRPLFESILAYENYPIDVALTEQGVGLAIRQVQSVQRVHYPLVVVAQPASELSLHAYYDCRRFDDAVIARLLGHLQTLLEGIAADPQQRLSALPLLTIAERQQLLVAWNDTRADYPQDSGIHQLFEDQATRAADAVALVFDGLGVRGQGSGVSETRRQGDKETRRHAETPPPTPNTQHPTPNTQHLTYRELNARANRLAHHLRSLGVGLKSRVGIMVERSPELIVGLLGILKAGGAYVPLDPAYPAERLAFMLEDAQVAVLLTTTDDRRPTNDQRQGDKEISRQGDKETESAHDVTPSPHHPLTPSPPHLVAMSERVVVDLRADWPAIAGACHTNPDSGVRGNNLAYVIYTSGSTGRPKGALVTHSGLCNLSIAQLQTFAVGPADRVLQFASLSFDASIFEIVMALRAGATLCMSTRDRLLPGSALLALLRDQAITTVTLPPSALAVLPGAELPALRTIVVAGEPCDAALATRWGAGRRFFNAYGPTEATVWATVAQWSGGAPPIGRPIANVQVYLLDSQHQPVPVGVPGELYIGGAGLARGYHHRPDLTAAAFIPNPFAGVLGVGCWVSEDLAPNTQHPTPNTRLYKTGDLARYRPDGMIEFLGRIDQQVKLRGFRIEVGEIEAVLAQHPSVRERVVVAREDVPGDKRLVAYVVPKIEDRGLKIEDSGSSAPDPLSSILYPLSSELRTFLQAKLPAYMVPSAFVVLDALPLTPSGKIDRRALPPPEGRPALDAAFVEPRTAVERTIVAVWQAVLHVEQVGVRDNFFDLGGHSLHLLQVQSKLREALGRTITAVDLFRYPTVGALAAYLSPSQSAPSVQDRTVAPAPTFAGAPDIAIIGMSGRFPGADSVEAFWRNLRDGVESISCFSDEELLAAGANPDLLDHPAYVKAGAWLPDIEYFDAAFFGYTPREAEFIDPQQRLFLECAWHALEHAGYDSERYPGRVGVYAGVGANNYLVNLYSNRDLVESMGAIQTALGNEKDHLTTRISYKLNLRGPSVNVQTACSTSLVAVHLAARSLLTGECAMALAGGISISPVQRTGYFYQEGGYVSPDGHCRAFDARAQGTVSSSGVGVVVLKRLADAIADGDQIYALIKGSAINNDGALRVGYTAPSVDGQVEVIGAALANAGVAPETIGYVETHGTGTPLGDPIEVAALTQVFGGAARAGTCAIGSLKTNVGHMDSAAGVAGLIKTALALQHRQIPPSLHFESPNPNIDFAGSPFYVNARLADWPADGAPRRAGVSSFGIGGTNAHVVLEEAPAVAPGGASRPWQLLLLSARTDTALETATDNLVAHLKAHPDLDLADVAYTLQVGRRAFNQRWMLVCRDRDDALAALEARDAQRVISGFQEPADRPIAFMFPGGGAQYANMAADLYRTEALFREVVDQCAELLRMHLGLDLREVLYPDHRPPTTDHRPPTTDHRRTTNDEQPFGFGQGTGDRGQEATTSLPPPTGGGTEGGRSQESDTSERTTQNSKLNTQNSPPNTQHPTPNTLDRTSLALPALFVTEYALAQLWMSWGVQPQALIGHSLGEYVAACLAGVLTLEDALALVALRGQLFERLPEGAMLSVPLAEEQLLPLLGADLSLAAVNGSALCVVSGRVEAIDRIAGRLTEQGVDVGRLHIAVAAHSALVEPILDTFVEFVATLRLQAPRIPYISNVSGTWISAAEATDPSYWVRHLRQTVRFAAGVQELLKEPNRILLEVGPGQTLSTLARQQPDAGAERVILTSLRHPREHQPDVAFLLNKVGQLWLAGAALDWNGFYRAERRRRLPLPAYPFERQRYWIERQQADNGRPQRPSFQKRPDIADWFYTPVWTQSTPAVEAGEPEQQTAAWLIFADPCSVGARLQHALERAGQQVTCVTIGQQFAPIGERAYTLDPRRPEDYDALLQELRTHDTFPGMIVHLWSITPESDTPADLERLERSQELGFYSLLFLAQALGKQQAPVQIAVVSNNMHEVAGEEVVRPEKATVLGPCKVIPHEYPNITCRSIDLALPAPGSWQFERLVDDLVAELTSQASDAVVAYHHNHRWVQRFEPVRLNGAGRSVRLREGGVYLITGGLGGIGLVLAEHLAQAARARLILLGRSAPPERERWDEWLEHHDEQDRTSRTIRQVRAIEALGAEVLIVSADVADEQQMRAAIARAYQRFGAIHGVIHAAGVAGGGIMQIKAPELAARVLAPKVRGTLVLDALFKDAKLDFFVLCSSLNALLGAIGQVDHCGANAFLDAFARRQAGGQAHFTVAINWPAWQEVGQVVDTAVPDELKAWREENIKQGILSKQGVEVFRRVLRSALPQVIVSPRDFQAEVEQNNAFSAANSLKELEQALLSRPTHPRPQLGTGYVAPKEGVEQAVADIWQKLLGIEQVGRHDDFFQLGGHSLVATQLMSRLRDAFQVELPLQSLFETPTVAGVAALIAQKQAEQADSEKLAQLLAEIRQLSPDQAQSILTAERQVIREGQTYD